MGAGPRRCHFICRACGTWQRCDSNIRRHGGHAVDWASAVFRRDVSRRGRVAGPWRNRILPDSPVAPGAQSPRRRCWRLSAKTLAEGSQGGITRGPALCLLTMSAILLGGGCSSDEPTAGTIQAQFEHARSGFDDLSRLFESDARARQLREVSARDLGASVCSQSTTGSACLSASQWKAYADRMHRLGVQNISRQPGSDRTYFVLYYRPFLMDARLRGVVHVPSSAQVKDVGRNEEWHRIDGQWYSFLKIDS